MFLAYLWFKRRSIHYRGYLYRRRIALVMPKEKAAAKGGKRGKVGKRGSKGKKAPKTPVPVETPELTGPKTRQQTDANRTDNTSLSDSLTLENNNVHENSTDENNTLDKDNNSIHDFSADDTPITAGRVHSLLQETTRDVQARLESFQNAILDKISALVPDQTSASKNPSDSSNMNITNRNDSNVIVTANNVTDTNLLSDSQAAAAGGDDRSPLHGRTEGRGTTPSRYAPAAAAVHAGDRDMSIDTDMIAKSLNQLLGKPTQSIVNPFANSNLLIAGSFLSVKVKSAIRAGEYVELGLMDARVETTTRAGIATTSTTISLNPTRTRKAKDETEWLRWFCVFASVYSESYPDAAPELFSYIIKILHFFAKYSFIETRNYDEQFRWAKSQIPTLNWHKTDHDILELVTEGRAGDSAAAIAKKNPMSRFKRPATFNVSNPPQKKPSGDRYCYDFNNADSYCTKVKCPFEHACAACKGNHPRYKCNLSSAASSAPTMGQATPKASGIQKGKIVPGVTLGKRG